MESKQSMEGCQIATLANTGGNMITKGFFWTDFFMVQFIFAFYSKEIILEQFIMKWIYLFYGCAIFVQNKGLPHICPRRDWHLLVR